MEHYPESHEIRLRSDRRSDWKLITHLQLDHREEVPLGAWHGKELRDHARVLVASLGRHPENGATLPGLPEVAELFQDNKQRFSH